MTIQELDEFLLETPVTYNSVRVDFLDGSFKVGFFENLVGDFDQLRRQNQWRFIEDLNTAAYKENGNAAAFTTIINGDSIEKLTAK